MKSVLISIQPKWCELVASGKKTVEVRKTKPKIETPFKVYIYCTKQGKQFFHGGIGEKECLFKNPDTEKIKFDYAFELMCCKNEYTKDNFLSGKVIGEFVCDCMTGLKADNMVQAYYNNTKDTCLTDEEIKRYANGGKLFYWHISDLVIYDKPRELREFEHECDGVCFDTKNKVKCEKITVDVSCNGLKPLTRPPQSWCYVESEGEK